MEYVLALARPEHASMLPCTQQSFSTLQGDMIRAKAAQEAADLKAAEAAAQARAQAALADTARANKALQEFKKAEAAREREADAAIERYAANKAEELAERQRREAARAAEKERQRQVMVRRCGDLATPRLAHPDRNISVGRTVICAWCCLGAANAMTFAVGSRRVLAAGERWLTS